MNLLKLIMYVFFIILGKILFLLMDVDLSQMDNYPKCIRYIYTPGECKNFPQFLFLPRVPRVEIECIPWV